MARAESGNTVRVRYTCKLDDGTVLHSSADSKPLEFKIGDERIIPAFEQAVIGMNPGETKTTTIPSAEAYGPYSQELLKTISREALPAGLEPEVGQRLSLTKPDGEGISVTVVDISGSGITVDANHPLAGQDLTFDIELIEIV